LERKRCADGWRGASSGRRRARAVRSQYCSRRTALVGHAGLLLDWDNEKAGLYYWMGVPYWGRGYATEAARELVRHVFEDLGLGRIYADHVARNPASGRVLQKVGMSYEGCRRRDFKKWDRFEDLALYGVLAEEWSPAAASASPR
jgi:[ribosomal protein S5]-alanine N-acetyltransferase